MRIRSEKREGTNVKSEKSNHESIRIEGGFQRFQCFQPVAPQGGRQKFFQVSSFPSTEEKTVEDDDEIVLSLEKLANSITKRGRSL